MPHFDYWPKRYAQLTDYEKNVLQMTGFELREHPIEHTIIPTEDPTIFKLVPVEDDMAGKDCQKGMESEIKKGLTKHQALNAAAGAGSVGKGKGKKKRGKMPK